MKSIRCSKSMKLFLLRYPKDYDKKKSRFSSLRLRDTCMRIGQYTFLVSQYKVSIQLGVLGSLSIHS